MALWSLALWSLVEVLCFVVVLVDLSLFDDFVLYSLLLSGLALC